MALAQGIPQSYHAPHHHKVAGLREIRSSEESGIAPGRWRYLAGLVQGSPETVHTLTQRLMHGAVSLIARNQRVEMRAVPFVITPGDSI